ncbi:AAA family ATPase [Actinosynnema sp. NPDC051121]
MTTLIATRGLPGSGKTTWTHEQLRAAEPGQLAACSRDEIRRMLHNATPYLPVTERQVTLVQHATIRTLLQVGVSVIVHDTNLIPNHLHALGDLARRCAVEFNIQDFTHVPLEVCLERDQRRENPVGSWFIRQAHEQLLAVASTTSGYGSKAGS